MSLPSTQRADLCAFALRQQDGTVTEADYGATSTLLITSEEARAYYLAHIALAARLRWALSTDRRQSSLGATLDRAAPRPSGSPLLGFLAGLHHRMPGGEFTVGALLLTVVVAAFYGLASFMFRPAPRSQPSVAASDSAGREKPAAPARVPAAPEPVFARVRSVGECLWGAGVAVSPDEELQPGRELELLRGFAELRLASGVRLVIEGPTKLTVLTPMRCELAVGRLFARAPHRAAGFTVATPLSEVIDLGTEFALEVGANQQSHLQVRVGRVRAIGKAEKAHGKVDGLNHQAEGEQGASASSDAGRIVAAGQAVRVSGAGAVEPIAADAPELALLSASRWTFRDEHDDDDALVRKPDGAAPESAARADRPASIIWLGNLFDDPRGTSLAAAMATDTYVAAAEDGDLGIASIAQGGPSTLPIGGALRFDFANLGWIGSSYGRIVNDAWFPALPGRRPSGIRTMGPAAESDFDVKLEEGISMHADAAITFDLDEIRAAGALAADKRLWLCVDRAGINREIERLQRRDRAAIHMAVIFTDGETVVGAQLDGRTAACVLHDGVASFRGPIGEPIRPTSPFFKVRIEAPAAARYVTLAVASAGDLGQNHGVWSGARLEIY